MLHSPLNALRAGNWLKLICGASFSDLPLIRNLTLAYALAGVDCVDVAAEPSVVFAVREAFTVAIRLSKQAQSKGFRGYNLPWLMVSLNDGEDPHFRKAEFNPLECPRDCVRPCEKICPAEAIAFSELFAGVVEQRCYGCGRCLPVCPQQLITAESYIRQPNTLTPLIEQMSIDAVEIHTQVGHLAAFQNLWSEIAPWQKHLKLLAISCPEHPDVINYLKTLYQEISPLSCPLIWQTDGRPMSGDIGKGTTHAAIKMAQKVMKAEIPGYVQLAGGTNDHTVNKLLEIGLLKREQTGISGIAYGSYARSLLLPILAQLPDVKLENTPQLLWEAVRLANTLVAGLKSKVA